MLSLSMIVRNEEACLEACLASVKGFVDEMVVLDTGSSDSTIAIAEAAGARVEQIPWPGDFAPARNVALEFVKGDWVLVLDADEQLCSECIPQLKSLMALDDVLVVNLLRFEKGSTMSPYSSVSRLFRRHPQIKWSRPYHSIVDDSVREIVEEETQWRVVDCDIPALIHDGYTPDLLRSRNKATRLREAMEFWLEKHPGDPYACAKLGALEISEGAKDRGLALLKQGLMRAEGLENNVNERYELLLNLGIALTSTDLDSAISVYREAMNLPMNDRANLGATLNLAALLMRQGLLEEAIALTQDATKRAPEVSIAWYNLGLMQRRSGDVSAALVSYSRALDLSPNQPEIHQNYALASLLIGNISGARESFSKAISLLLGEDRKAEADELLQQISGVLKVDDLNI